jgi:DNA-binding response OmpR family regulator
VAHCILVIDDEPAIRETLSDILGRSGFEVMAAGNGAQGLQMVGARLPDLIVLDIRMPGMDGLEVLRRLRSAAGTLSLPVILLTAESSEADRVVGLELGADDYVVKPFSPRELVARVRAILRRTASSPRLIAPIRRGELSLDPVRHIVAYAGNHLDLTAMEFRILQWLAAHAGELQSRQSISKAARDDEGDPLDRSIDAHIKSIRKKLGIGGGEIETVRGFGYRLR